MINYGLTPKDREQLESKKNLYSGFGRDSRDYIHLYVYNKQGTLVEDEIFSTNVVDFTDEKTINLDIGTHLRELGYSQGEFSVQYLFLRKIAGKDDTVFINDYGDIHRGKIQTKVVNGVTKYFSTKKFGNRNSQAELTEIFPKEMKYVFKKISQDRTEVEINYQDIKNGIYRKNLKEINRIINYTPTKLPDNDAGTIRFDLTDPYVLVGNFDEKDRGFTDAMVGGEISIQGIYEINGRIIQEEEIIYPDPPPPDPIDILDVDYVKKQVKDKVPTPFVDIVEDFREELPEEDIVYGWDESSSICFVGDTKIKLSNNRTIPIKMMKPGMKVKTQQGYAKVLKVTKENLPYGDRFVKFGKLITTNSHPIFYKGGWYLASELGKEFHGEPTDVWNLQLDKHHTIYADNVVSATLNKWKSDNNKSWKERFFESRNRFKMLRPAGPIPGGGNYSSMDGEVGFTDEGGLTYDAIPEVGGYSTPKSTPFVSDNEVVMDRVVPTLTTKEIVKQIKVSRNTPLPIVIPEIREVVSVDYKAKIIEVLDHNRVRVNKSWEDMSLENKNIGEDTSKDIYQDFMVQYIKHQVERLNTYLVAEGTYNLITNMIPNPDNPESRFVKLYQPLPPQIETMDLCYFVEEKMEPYYDSIKLFEFVDSEEELLFLRLPDFNSVNNPVNFRGTNFSSFNDLIGTDTGVKEDVQNLILSSSLLDVQVNVDYSKRTDSIDPLVTDYGFGNFVQFGSAEKRIKNFKKKIDLIQTYTSQSLSLNDVTGSSGTTNEYDNKKRRVINSFDPYENYLYTQSGSYVSSSVGEFYSATWPKDNSSSPYILTHTSASAATDWYSTWTGYAKAYDDLNRERLVNNIPLHVTADTENNYFLNFMDMIGQQFDEIYVYLRHFTDINERTSKLSEGISKDIVREVAKSAGFEVTNGNDLLILPHYKLGKEIDGSALYESPQEEVTEEIWKRILANTPYFMKTKGTKRAIQGLLNCYGIPSSILRVREYGGPDKGTAVNYEIKRKFTYALDFKSSEYLRLPWKQVSSKVPETVEFRFRSPKSKDQTIVQSGDKWAIQLQDNGATDDYGYLRFAVSASTGVQYITSSLHPFYNDDMWSVMLTRVSSSGLELSTDTITQDIKYELTTRQYDSTREVVLFSSSESIDIDGDTAAGAAFNSAFSSSEDFYIGGDGTNFGTQFSGSMMEFRLWSEPLSQSVFENHVRAPKTYNGNTTSSFYDNLIFRLPLDNNVSYQTFTSASQDKSYIKSYHTSASAHNFTDNNFRSLVDLEQLRVPNLGPNRRNATKIRIEDTTLSGPLASNVRREQSSQDFAPIDSNKLGIYFSPTDIVNEDIAYSIADFNFDDYVGDPRDQYEDTYRGLGSIQRTYWKKYSRTNNFWDYLRIINFYDGGIWQQLRKMVPARAKSTLGVLIEPNVLERSKQVVGKPPEFENVYYENAGHFEFGLQLSSRESSSIGHPPFSFNGEYRLFGQSDSSKPTNGVLNVHNNESGSLGTISLPSLVRLGEIDPRSEYGSLYATASVTFNGSADSFTETLQTFISSSRISEHNEIKNKIYANSLDAITDTPLSSSFEPAEFQSMAYDSKLFRLFYKGNILTKDNTIDGGEPIEITITTPTKLVTTDSGESKLKTDV